jgi:putative two-component system protein, hydrogenase maturation factor HypX/HoxX
MGNLYGSEYWTYLLPRRVGADVAEAGSLGLVDAAFGETVDDFVQQTRARAVDLARAPDCAERLEAKHARRLVDEAEKALADYRARELERMRLNFYGFDPSYHVARYNFVHKVPKSRTPLTIALHRRVSGAGSQGASKN